MLSQVPDLSAQLGKGLPNELVTFETQQTKVFLRIVYMIVSSCW